MKPSFLFVSLALFTSAFLGRTLAEDKAAVAVNPTQILAEVDGVKLTLADLGRKHPGAMFKAYQDFYQTQRTVVAGYVDEYLLERQAKKENVTVAELLERHVKNASGAPPSEELLRAYYDTLDTDKPYDVMRQPILEHLQQGREAKAKAEFLKKLRSEAHINLQFGPPRAELAWKGHAVRGPQDAPVVIVEFADYECPYCQQAQAAVDQIETEYKGKIAFVYKDLPLPNHAHAQPAAEASRCAGAQNKYWEYHDLLFKTRALDLPKLKEHAAALNLDMQAFDKCLTSGAQAEAIKADFNEGVDLGLQGTPGFFINGRFFSGGMSVEQFRTVIGEELATSAAKSK